jgi:hypothetical protein
MNVAALDHRTAFDRAFPLPVGIHTPQEDRWSFQERLLKAL